MIIEPRHATSLCGLDEGAFQVEELTEVTNSSAHYMVRLSGSLERATMVVMAAGLSDRPREVESFYREVFGVNRIHHPGVPRVVDHGWSERIGVYAIYEVEGARSLGLYLRQEGPQTVRETTKLLRGIFSAVEEVHAHGICHGALSMDNIILSRGDAGEPEVRIVGFGLARLFSLALTDGGEHVPGLAERLLYASPEQCAGEPATALSDIYAVGAIAYEMLYGKPPFAICDLHQLIQNHLHTEPPRPSRGEFQVPDGLEALVFKMLCKDPGDRTVSAAGFACALPTTVPPMLKGKPGADGEIEVVDLVEHADDGIPGERVALPWDEQHQQTNDMVSRMVEQMLHQDATSPPLLPAHQQGPEAAPLKVAEQQARAPEIDLVIDLTQVEQDAVMTLEVVPAGMVAKAEAVEQPAEVLAGAEAVEQPAEILAEAEASAPLLEADGQPPPAFRVRNIAGFATVMAALGLTWLGLVMLIDRSNEPPLRMAVQTDRTPPDTGETRPKKEAPGITKAQQRRGAAARGAPRTHMSAVTPWLRENLQSSIQIPCDGELSAPTAKKTARNTVKKKRRPIKSTARVAPPRAVRKIKRRPQPAVRRPPRVAAVSLPVAASARPVPPQLLGSFRRGDYRNAFYRSLVHLQDRPRDGRLLTIKGVCACHLNMEDVARRVHKSLRGTARTRIERACKDNDITLGELSVSLN